MIKASAASLNVRRFEEDSVARNIEHVELVVKIPKEAYELLKNDGVDWLGAEHILNAVANGTPLPRGHQRLIEESEIDTVDN